MSLPSYLQTHENGTVTLRRTLRTELDALIQRSEQRLSDIDDNLYDNVLGNRSVSTFSRLMRERRTELDTLSRLIQKRDNAQYQHDA